MSPQMEPQTSEDNGSVGDEPVQNFNSEPKMPTMDNLDSTGDEPVQN